MKNEVEQGQLFSYKARFPEGSNWTIFNIPKINSSNKDPLENCGCGAPRRESFSNQVFYGEKSKTVVVAMKINSRECTVEGNRVINMDEIQDHVRWALSTFQKFGDALTAFRLSLVAQSLSENRS